ncbi:Ger(x)C family spore germination protein [Ammoniphilus sp. YIM 78166]|uniref:Ger(x)C family spore germination protein n=1 Tax=Ammoniphilus sp. YIM 78166 TaxID=1644106 RepID=UPI00106F4EBB|nr:Ger(x)C family spore germination protein [Ammoniphilus sp. YIM 78166]
MHPNRWVRSVKCVGILLCFVPLLSGCWDRLEIEERAVVLAIAVDEEDPEEVSEESAVAHLGGKVPEEQKRLIRLTVQIAVPGRIPLGPGEGGGGGTEKPVWVIDVVGHTVEDAFSNLQQLVSDRLFFGHLRIIVVNEKVARKGLQNLNDALRRNAEVRRAAWMIVSKGKAAELVSLEPELERVPALYLLATMDGSVELGKLPNSFLGVFWSAMTSKGQEGYLPYVELQKNQSVLISGLAYFKGSKMAGITLPIEIGNYMAIKGINPGGYTVLVEVPGEAGAVMFESTERKSKIEVKMKDGKPHVKVKVHIEGNLIEKSNAQFKVGSSASLHKIESQIGKNAEEAFMKLIKKTQKQGSDIFGFGEHVRGKHPTYWSQHIKEKEKWQAMYKEIPVHVQVDISIRRIGMKAS